MPVRDAIDWIARFSMKRDAWIALAVTALLLR